MTAPAAQEVIAACERFGGRVWDALAAAGHEHYAASGDGFDIIRPTTGCVVHVVVTDRREGPLKGCGPWRAVTAQRLAPLRSTLTEAGYGVAVLEDEGSAVALVVTPTPGTAADALAFARAARRRQASQASRPPKGQPK